MPSIAIPPSVASLLQESPRGLCLDRPLVKPFAVKDADELKELRNAEFRIGRELAQRALERLGWRALQDPSDRDLVVAKGQDRAPIWPSGFVGSISHSDRWVWAAAALSQEFHSIGIDTEVLVDPSRVEDLRASIGTKSEFARLQADFGESLAFTLLFSAKEAFFKMCYPLTGCMWEFADVELVNVSLDHRNPECGAASGALILRCRDSAPRPAAESSQGLYLFDPTRPQPVRFQADRNDVFCWCGLPVGP